MHSALWYERIYLIAAARAYEMSQPCVSTVCFFEYLRLTEIMLAGRRDSFCLCPAAFRAGIDLCALFAAGGFGSHFAAVIAMLAGGIYQ